MLCKVEVRDCAILLLFETNSGHQLEDCGYTNTDGLCVYRLGTLNLYFSGRWEKALQSYHHTFQLDLLFIFDHSIQISVHRLLSKITDCSCLRVTGRLTETWNRKKSPTLPRGSEYIGNQMHQIYRLLLGIGN